MPFVSRLPAIDLPNLPIWTFLFNSTYSALHPANNPPSQIGSFISSATDNSLQFTYTQLPHLTTYFSTALTRLYGLQRGDVLVCFAANSTWYAVPMWGVIRVGGVFCGGNPAYAVSEMVYALQNSGAKFVVADVGSLEKVREACKLVGINEQRIFLLEEEQKESKCASRQSNAASAGGHVMGVRDLCELGKGWGDGGQVEELKLSAGENNGDLLGFLAFSSGTTGLPKAAMISHRNVIAQCCQMQATYLPGTPEKCLAVLPFFHIVGLINILHVSLLTNRTIIILTPPFSMQNFLQAIVRYEIRTLNLVPPLLLLLSNHPLVKDYHDIPLLLTRVTSGAAPLSMEAMVAFQTKFPIAKITQGYGMTETTGCITTTPHDQVEQLPQGSVGVIVGSTEIRIVDQNEEEVQEGCEGEIRVRGPQCITLGYLGNEGAIEGLYDKQGWLKTGDWGWIDGNGWVFVTDRVKEMIKVKGLQVAPAELEDCLLGHPLISDCAVIAFRHPYLGEVPHAFIVLRQRLGSVSDKEVIGKEIEEYVRERKSKEKWIVGGVSFVEQIPKSPSGKILRRVLRDNVRAEERKKGVKL